MTTLKSVSEGLKVIDVDCHWNEPPDLWTSRAPAKYKDRVPQMRLLDGRSNWYIEGDVDFGYGVICVIDKEKEKRYGLLSIATVDDIDEAASDATARVKYMDEHGIWAELVYPNAAGFSAAKFMGKIHDEELELQCLKIYNDAASDWQKESGDRLFPMALVPVRSMDQAVSEMRRAVEDLGLKGFVISDNLGALGLPDYNHPYWDPFWEAASALDVPVNFHTGGTLLDNSRAPWKHYTAPEKLAMNTTAANVTNAAAMANILLSGIHDRYPRVKFVSVESGIGWIPFLLETLDHNLDEMVPSQMRRTKRKPSEYFQEHWWACFWFEEQALQHQLEEIGVNKVMFETDYPHPTCLYPNNEEWIERTLRGVDKHSLRRILQDNALELYKLPVPVSV